jgi:quinol monooxygenase YgiN
MKYLWALLLFSSTYVSAQSKETMIRIAEIEVDSMHLEAYKSILAEESKASIQLEPGVIAIFPLYEKANPTQIRILEVYANRQAYEAHLKSAHFLKYKSSTMQMVKHLNLVEMESIDAAMMSSLFRKMQQ